MTGTQRWHPIQQTTLPFQGRIPASLLRESKSCSEGNTPWQAQSFPDSHTAWGAM